MNFKLSIFVALVVGALLVLAAPSPATGQGQASDEEIKRQRVNCGFKCYFGSVNPDQCMEACMKGPAASNVQG